MKKRIFESQRAYIDHDTVSEKVQGTKMVCGCSPKTILTFELIVRMEKNHSEFIHLETLVQNFGGRTR